jgi:hypothetical protein
MYSKGQRKRLGVGWREILPQHHLQTDDGSPIRPTWARSTKSAYLNKSGFQKGKLVRSSCNTKRAS